MEIFCLSDKEKISSISLAFCLCLLAITTKFHIGVYFSLAVYTQELLIYLYLSKKDFKVIIKPAVLFIILGLMPYVILILD